MHRWYKIGYITSSSLSSDNSSKSVVVAPNTCSIILIYLFVQVICHLCFNDFLNRKVVQLTAVSARLGLLNISAVYTLAPLTATLVLPSAAASVVTAANPALATTKDMRNPLPDCLNVFFTVPVNGECTVGNLPSILVHWLQRDLIMISLTPH